MRVVLVIIFIALYVTNHKIMGLIYPDYQINYDVFLQYYYTRSQVYELLFLVGLCIPFTKPSLTGNSFIILAIALLVFSNIDKVLLGNFSFVRRDWFVLATSIIAARTYYEFYRRKNKHP